MEDEKALYWTAMNALMQKNEDTSKQIIRDIEAHVKKVYREVDHTTQSETLKNAHLVVELIQAIENAQDRLLETEITQLEQTEVC